MPKQTWQYALDMMRMRKARGNRCSRCGATHDLEFAHRRATGVDSRGLKHRRQGRGLRRRCLDIKRNPDAYELLCAGCHDEAPPDVDYEHTQA